jgi:hypothetical protein
MTSLLIALARVLQRAADRCTRLAMSRQRAGKNRPGKM